MVLLCLMDGHQNSATSESSCPGTALYNQEKQTPVDFFSHHWMPGSTQPSYENGDGKILNLDLDARAANIATI